MSPAEELAKSKPRRKSSPNEGPSRKPVWTCRLGELRTGLRLSLNDVAKACGYCVATIFQLEHGGDPMLSTALKLAVFFGKSVEEIWSSLSEEQP